MSYEIPMKKIIFQIIMIVSFTKRVLRNFYKRYSLLLTDIYRSTNSILNDADTKIQTQNFKISFEIHFPDWV